MPLAGGICEPVRLDASAVIDGLQHHSRPDALGEQPDLGVILYTGLPDWDVLCEALDCGARGFVLKAGSPQELMTARALTASDRH